jgi:hypothetical protein
MPTEELGPVLAAAIAAAQPGAVIELETGTYTGQFTILDKVDLTLRARRGAHVVLTHRDPRFAAPNQLWSPVEGARDLYRTTEGVGSSIYRQNGDRILYAKTRSHLDQLIADGIPSAFRETGETLLYLSGDDPRTTPLWVSETDASVVTCDSSPRLRLEGLDIRFGGAVGIEIKHGCDGAVIEGVSIYGGRDGIRVKDGLSQQVTVRRSWIANHIDRRWFWRDIKGNLPIEGSAVLVPGIGQRVEENVIQGWFNGVQTFCFVETCPAVDPLVRRNLIVDILDDAIEMDGVTVRGEVSENLIRDVFMGFSFAPRLVRTPGEDTRIHHNTVKVTRTPLFDRDQGSIGRPSLTKFNGGRARDLLFEHNTVVGDGHLARGAPTGSLDYPIHVRWLRNILVSRKGPLVRDTGSPSDGNLFEGNVYSLGEPTGFAYENWALPAGQTSDHATLAAARASDAGRAAGWESQGFEALPEFALPGEPSSLRQGSRAAGRGAFAVAPLRVDSTIELPTGWTLVRGAGFESTGSGLGVENPIVVSSTTAFARSRDLPPAPPLLIDVQIVP